MKDEKPSNSKNRNASTHLIFISESILDLLLFWSVSCSKPYLEYNNEVALHQRRSVGCRVSGDAADLRISAHGERALYYISYIGPRFYFSSNGRHTWSFFLTLKNRDRIRTRVFGAGWTLHSQVGAMHKTVYNAVLTFIYFSRYTYQKFWPKVV